MKKSSVTPKDFFLWLGAVVAFYWSVLAYTFLLFDYINYVFGSASTYYTSNPYQSGISADMASIIVLLPLYIALMWVIRKDMARDPSRKNIWVRRWAIILTLFLSGIAITADLIALLTTFFNGEALTTVFSLKVLVILLVAAGVFMHFSAELKGYWERFPKRNRSIGIGVGVLGFLTIFSGFIIIGTPADARLVHFDEQKVMDLQDLQSRITNYWQAKQKLPNNLDALNNPLMYTSLPIDPQTGNSYGYHRTNTLSFELCAVFNKQNVMDSALNLPRIPETNGTSQNEWQHGSGEVCFDRTLDPSFFPPFSK